MTSLMSPERRAAREVLMDHPQEAAEIAAELWKLGLYQRWEIEMLTAVALRNPSEEVAEEEKPDDRRA